MQPFPSQQIREVFLATQTVMPDGTLANWFAPGSPVVFRAYAVDPKTRKVVAAKDVKYFYVTIPNQPNVKLKYDPTAAGAMLAMGDTRWQPGTSRTIVFGHSGVYRLVAKNVKSSDEMGLATLGPDNTLVLTIRVP